MSKQKGNMTKAEKYLETVEPAVNLKDIYEIPPSRVRAILLAVFKDYYDRKINEDILVEVGHILHNLQFGAWDYDPEIMGITCDLDDQHYKLNRIKEKGKREQLYKKLFRFIQETQTISVSLDNKEVERLNEKKKKNEMIHNLIKKAVNNF